MNKICNDYCKLINNKFKSEVKTIVIYGSNIYSVNNCSDLDVCIIVKDNNKYLQENIINETIKFHKDNNLKIDEEIPFTNKLIYTIDEIEETLNNHPFIENGKVIIHDIVKDNSFLSSKKMKQRLLFNILTTDHLSIGDSMEKYEKNAFKIIIEVIIKFFNIKDKSESEILKCMYKNKYTGSEGEMYLGYKKKYPEKETFLKRKIHEIIKIID